MTLLVGDNLMIYCRQYLIVKVTVLKACPVVMIVYNPLKRYDELDQTLNKNNEGTIIMVQEVETKLRW